MLKLSDLKVKGCMLFLLLLMVAALSAASCNSGGGGGGGGGSSGGSVDRNWTPSQQYLDAMTNLDTERTNTYAAVQMMYALCADHKFPGYPDYYNNGAGYYARYVAGYFNAWIDRLATEAQDGADVNVSDDQNLLEEALQANKSFSDWVQQVDSYLRYYGSTTTQGGGYLAAFSPNGEPLLSPELLTAIAPDVVQGVFSLLNSAASAIGQEAKDNAQQDQQKQAQIANDIRTHKWAPYMSYCTG